MRSSKVFLLLSLIAAIVLLISSEVAARDLAETTSSTENGAKHAIHEDGFPGTGHSPAHPGQGGFSPGSGGSDCKHGCCEVEAEQSCTCCASAAEAAQYASQVKPQN